MHLKFKGIIEEWVEVLLVGLGVLMVLDEEGGGVGVEQVHLGVRITAPKSILGL